MCVCRLRLLRPHVVPAAAGSRVARLCNPAPSARPAGQTLPCARALPAAASGEPAAAAAVHKGGASASRQGIAAAATAAGSGGMTVNSSTAAAPAPAAVSIAPAGASASIGDRKLRILCLHGYLQNAEVFRMRIGSLRKALKSRAEFFFVDAPYPAAADAQAVAESGGSSGAQGRSWWQWSDIEPGTRPSRAAHYSGWEASQAAIEAALAAHAPIDGLLGFSQGATAAALFLAHASQATAAAAAGEQQRQPAAEGQQGGREGLGREQERQQLESALRFAVVIAGFLPRDASYAAALRAGRPSLPSLHVHGAADELVPEERSAALWACFPPGCVRTFKHPGAHMVPTCSGPFKQALVELLEEVKQGRLPPPQQPQEQQPLEERQPAAAVA